MGWNPPPPADVYIGAVEAVKTLAGEADETAGDAKAAAQGGAGQAAGDAQAATQDAQRIVREAIDRAKEQVQVLVEEALRSNFRSINDSIARVAREGSAKVREAIAKLQQEEKRLREAGTTIMAVVTAVVLIIVMVVAVIATFGTGTSLSVMLVICCVAVIAAAVGTLAVTVVLNVGPLAKGAAVVARHLGLEPEGRRIERATSWWDDHVASQSWFVMACRVVILIIDAVASVFSLNLAAGAAAVQRAARWLVTSAAAAQQQAADWLAANRDLDPLQQAYAELLRKGRELILQRHFA